MTVILSAFTIVNNFHFLFFFQEEAGKWTSRGVSLYLDHNYFLAERCTSVALYFRVDNPFFKAQSFFNRALSRFELGDISGTQSDAQEVKRLDKHFARVRELLSAKILNNGFNVQNPIASQRSALRSNFNNERKKEGFFFFLQDAGNFGKCHFRQIGTN